LSLARIPLQPPRGMDDYLPEETALLNRLVGTVRELFRLYGYSEVETPAVEYYELFAAKSGVEILEHMYVFKDAHGRLLALRPEMTAPIARLVAGKMSRRPLPLRLGYVADCYRLDEPQWGRRRRFYHGGFEIFGSRSPLTDVETLMICEDFMRRVGVSDCTYKLGHVGVHRGVMSAAGIGDSEQDVILSLIDRGKVEDAVRRARSEAKDSGVVETFQLLVETPAGPAAETCEKVESVVQQYALAREAASNMREIVGLASSVIEPGRLVYDPGFARGLSYYTGFIFEAYGPKAEVALAGGGRYDGLLPLIGGLDIPGVGFAIGITRVLHYLVDKMGHRPSVTPPLFYAVALAKTARSHLVRAVVELRRAGVPVEMEAAVYSPSEALPRAQRRGARYVLMIGDREIERGVVTVRDLSARTQEEWRIEQIHARGVELLGRR
jgi:histidyl-tRNA synthetase